MVGLVKKTSLLLFVLVILCLSSCVNHSAVIKENAEEMMQCIIDRDAEKLLTYFSEDIRENRTEETLEEIEKLFEFIDGDIVSYIYDSGGTRGSTSNFEYDFYLCYPTFQSVETTTGKIYTIRFAYNYIWKEKPEQEGFSRIKAFSGEDWVNLDKGVTVGKLYKIPSVWQ